MRLALCVLSSAALTGLSSAGCDRLDRRESLLSEPVDQAELQRTSGAGLPFGAVEAIARARCTREQRCNNIGAGREYATEADCEASVRVDWEDDLNSVDCPRGVKEAALAECLREIRDTQCDDLADTLGRWTRCAATEICDSPEEIDISPP